MSPADKRRGARGRKYKAWGPDRRKKRREMGQNFLRHESTARRIVEASGVTGRDLALEFGAGAGMLTRPLSRRARKVIAVERDSYWAGRLERRFSGNEKVEVVVGDALTVSLPEESFKVVANVPFHITTKILHRLLDNPEDALESACLLVQKELAEKHARPRPTTLKTLNWSPWWRFGTDLNVPSSAFEPRPEVDACLLVATRRELPIVPPEHRESFRAFVRAAFNGRGNTVSKVLRPFFTGRQLRRLARDNGFSPETYPARLTVHQWSSVFEFMVRAAPQSHWPRIPRTKNKYD